MFFVTLLVVSAPDCDNPPDDAILDEGSQAWRALYHESLPESGHVHVDVADHARARDAEGGAIRTLVYHCLAQIPLPKNKDTLLDVDCLPVLNRCCYYTAL